MITVHAEVAEPDRHRRPQRADGATGATGTRRGPRRSSLSSARPGSASARAAVSSPSRRPPPTLSGLRAARATSTMPSVHPAERPMPTSSKDPGLPDPERAHEDPDGKHDAVEQPLGKQRSGRYERRDPVVLAHGLDAQQVAPARRQHVVRTGADAEDRQQAAGLGLVPGGGEQVAPAQRDEADCSRARIRAHRRSPNPAVDLISFQASPRFAICKKSQKKKIVAAEPISSRTRFCRTFVILRGSVSPAAHAGCHMRETPRVPGAQSPRPPVLMEARGRDRSRLLCRVPARAATSPSPGTASSGPHATPSGSSSSSAGSGSTSSLRCSGSCCGAGGWSRG